MREYKAVPLGYAPDDVAALDGAPAALRDFPTPLVTLSESAVAHNLATMADWCRSTGIGLAPHGKTTMSRELWQRQLDAGAWGITVATPWQAAVALGWGVPRVLLANALVQPAALRTLAPDTDRLTVWADSVRAVEIMTETLAGSGLPDGALPEPLAVLVELGAPGGRTGSRTAEEALAVARAVAASPVLRLAGVAGYEGALAHDGSAESLATVRGYLERIGAVHDALEDAGLYPADAPAILTAGGSAYFDVVAEVLAPRRDLAGARGRVVEVLLRSGAYLTHDDGFYSVIAPLGRAGGGTFRSAIHGWATVVSRPEPGLALVDGGKRDFPYDEGLPVPQAVRAYGADHDLPLSGAVVTAMNDQHTFVRLPSHARVEVGDVIRFGLSHPCTTFDKWRALPVVDDALGADPRVIGLLETTFG